jgi:hypothetical protein
VATLIGSFGLFFTLFCLFVRFLPVIALAEVKGVLPQANPHFVAKPEPKHKRHVSKSAVGVVESRDGSEDGEGSARQPVKVVVSGAHDLREEKKAEASGEASVKKEEGDG